MITPNMHYCDLKDSYLFFNIAKKTKAYLEEHPGTHLYRMGIGDVSLPLCDAVIKALHEAVDDQASSERFHGYMPEPGAPFTSTHFSMITFTGTPRYTASPYFCCSSSV